MKKKSQSLFLALILVSAVFQIALRSGADVSMGGLSDGFRSGGAAIEQQVFAFSDLGIHDPISLRGPYQQFTIPFALPPDWQVNANLRVEMNITSEFQSLLEAFTQEEDAQGFEFQRGVIQVALNGTRIGTADVTQEGDSTVVFSAPRETLREDAQVNELVIAWEASAACDQSVTSRLVISAGSSIDMPHSAKQVRLKLKDFPSPFFTDHAMIPYPTALVIPDDADADTISSLMAVSSAFGKLVGDHFDYEILEASRLDEARHADYHLVLLGDLEAVNAVFHGTMRGDRISLPNQARNAEDGFLTYQVSPWNAGRNVLIVTGEKGLAVRNASAVLASDQIIPFSDGNNAVVKDISEPSASVQFQVDQTLGGLIPEKSLKTAALGESVINIPFSIPGDIQISPETYLELYFRHSQLLNYLQSNISIHVNGELVGTIRFSDPTAENGLARIILPPNVLKPARNLLQITFTIIPQDICADERSGNYWISIFGDSYLHIPPTLETAPTSVLFPLNNVHQSLLEASTFSNLVYVLDTQEISGWQFASQLALTLGALSDADIMRPAVRFVGELDEIDDQYDYVLIGDVSSIPFESGMNAFLPFPFEAGGVLPQESLGGVQFEVDAGENIGVIQSARVPEQNTTIIGVFGNSEQGLQSAMHMLIEQVTSDQMKNANLVIIDGAGESHAYLIQPESAVSGTEQAGSVSWLGRILSTALQSPALVLLIVFSIITIGFITWAIRKKSVN